MSKTFGPETVRKVADLARLKLTDAEVEKFANQLGGILGYIEKLSELNTANVEPLTSGLELATPMREDELRPSPGAAVITSSAPDSLYENYKVPQVMSEIK